METNKLATVTETATANIYNMPVGTVMPYMGLKANLAGLRAQGWLPCDGTKYGTAELPALYAAIGNSCGGNTSDFYLPNLQGMFLRGVDTADHPQDPDSGSRTAQNPGGHAGNEVGTRQGDAFKKHTHNTNEWNTSSFRITHHDNNWHPPCEVHVKPSSEAGDSTETRPKNVSVYYIIFAGLPVK